MKRALFTIALLLGCTIASHAQKVIKTTREKLADIFLLDDTLLIYAVKEADGQYLYTEKRGEPSSYKKHETLNVGAVNAVIGTGVTGKEVYVYQKIDASRARIAFYRWDGVNFWKTGEKPFPEIRNHSYNLGAYLSPGQNMLLIAADLRRTRGYDDLYLSKWEHSRWTRPVGFGAPPNTRNPEFSPYVTSDSIFFSRQEGDNAFVYGLPLSGTYGGGVATKLGAMVNKDSAFTTGYKRLGTREMWITRSDNGVYRAYLTGPDLEPKPEPKPIAELPTAEEVAVAQAKPSTFTVLYGMNIIYMTDAQTVELDSFLAEQPKGSHLTIKGFSDNVGTEEGKKRVARQRAVLFRLYIERKFADKEFTFETESEVLRSVGPAYRRVEVTSVAF